MHGHLAVILLCAICIVGFGMCTGELIELNKSECKDFYGYVCENLKDSGFRRRNHVTPREANVPRLEFLKFQGKTPYMSYYNSCLDRSSSERFLSSKFNQINKIIYKEKKILTEHDLAKLLDETSILNNAFFEYGLKNGTNNTFVIGGRTSLKSSELSPTNKLYEEYKTFINQVFKELDPLYDEDEWGNVLKLEGEIINVVNNYKARDDISYFFNEGKQFYDTNKINRENFTIFELQKELKKSEWSSQFDLSRILEFFNNRILSGIENSKVIFMGLPYFLDLQETLGGYTANIIAKYILLRGTIFFYHTLPKRFKEMLPSKDLARKLYIELDRDESVCETETIRNLKYIEEQFYMDKSFYGQAKIMADELYKGIKTNLEKQLNNDHCMPNNVKVEILTKLKDIKVHLGRFELPYFQYKKTSFYNGSYFENFLASKRDFSPMIADGERGIDLAMFKKFRGFRKSSYYDGDALYIFSYVFNSSSKRKSEFFGAAGPHIVQSLFDVFQKENFENCSVSKQKGKLVSNSRKNLEEFFLETKLSITLKAYQDSEIDTVNEGNIKSQDSKSDSEQDSDNENQSGIQHFFLTFVQEFCDATNENKERLNKILSSNPTFQKAFHCSAWI